jgi:hypothetical protein
VREDAPWLFAYIEKGMRYLLHLVRMRRKGVKGEAEDGLVFVDLDAVAEGVDVLFGLRRHGVDDGTAANGDTLGSLDLSENMESVLNEAMSWLVESQLEDGSWPAIWHPTHRAYYNKQNVWDEKYCELHPTWVTTFALCNRPVHQRNKMSAEWLDYIQPQLKVSSFTDAAAEGQPL